MTRRQLYIGIASLVACGLIFVLPFLFIIITAAKTKQDAASLTFTLPQEWRLLQNFIEVIQTRNYMLLLAYFNSTIITVAAVSLLVLLGAMVGYLLQGRASG